MASVTDKEMSGISDARIGLVQTVIDNFDCNISSQNGLQSTHSLAVLMTQSKANDNDANNANRMKRLEKEEMKSKVPPDVLMHLYKGPQKPSMPTSHGKSNPLPLHVLASQRILLTRSHVLDFQFLKDVVSNPQTPKSGGFNTMECREQQQSVKPATKAVYKPLIAMIPSDPSIILTAMYETQKDTQKTGQHHTIMTADQQLYCMIVHETRAFP